jgi:FkbM family methyltransferase
LLALRGIGIYNYTSFELSGEKWLIKHIVKKMGRDLIVFDVGANIGNYAKEIVSMGVSVDKIFAFEPHPVTYTELRKNVSDIGQITPCNMALSNTKGEMSLFDKAGNNGTSKASFSQEVFSEIYGLEAIEVKVNVDTLDDFCQSHSINYIDFLKIDVEGFELSVIQGAAEMIQNNRVGAIQFEFTQLNAIVGVFFREIYDLLSPNYKIYRMIPHGLMEIKEYDPTMCEIFGYQNYFAVCKSLS